MDEAWISVDIEASGPTPSTGSMIALGACLVEQPSVQFETTITPLPGMPWSDEAERIHRLSRERLALDGTSPENAMRSLVDWVDTVAAGRRPIFVGFNAPFDWMFVADYLWRFVGRNPFGISALDLKSVYLGRCWGEVRRWSETSSDAIAQRYGLSTPHTHAPLDDALEQAEICRVLLDLASQSSTN